MARTDPRALAARLADLTARIGTADRQGWLADVDDLTAALRREGRPLPAPLAAAAAEARVWLAAREPGPLGDDDWTVWRFADEAVFRRPGARVFVDGTGIRLALDGKPADKGLDVPIAGRLADARVDVPTGRGARTGRARLATDGGEVRIELKGTRLVVKGGPAAPIDREW